MINEQAPALIQELLAVKFIYLTREYFFLMIFLWDSTINFFANCFQLLSQGFSRWNGDVQ
jgi:hypothetical protein